MADDQTEVSIAPNADENAPKVEGEAPAAPLDAKPPEKLLKKYKIKVDGKDVEEEIDLNDDKEVSKRLQMSRAASKRMEEAKSERDKAEAVLQMLKTDPIKVLSNPAIGVNFRELAEKYLMEQIQEETLTPDQKMVRQAQKILAERDAEEKGKKESAEKEQIAQLEKHYSAQYEKTIVESLQHGGIPKTPSTVKSMAKYMQKNLEYGLDLDPKELVSLVRDEYIQTIREVVGTAEGDALLQILGEDVSNRIRKHDLAKFRASKGQLAPSAQAPSGAPGPKNRSMTKDEWRAELDRRAKE